MSAARRKGTSAESAVVTFLRSRGWLHAERRAAAGAKDRGDVAGVPGVVIEVKNCAKTELASWLDEAAVERANDGADLAVVWHKRRGRGDAGDWFVTMDGATAARLLSLAGYGGTASDLDGRANGDHLRVSAEERSDDTKNSPKITEVG